MMIIYQCKTKVIFKMKISKALNRIGWRFGGNDNKNPFPVNENDIEAFNVIADYVEEAQKKQYEANELFAKLYVHNFTKILERDGATVFENRARDLIGGILKMPLEQIIENLQKSLNESEHYGLFKDAGVSLKHPALRSEGETKQGMKKLNEMLKNDENLKKFKGNVWDYDTVSNAVVSEVNQMINLYK